MSAMGKGMLGAKMSSLKWDVGAAGEADADTGEGALRVGVHEARDGREESLEGVLWVLREFDDLLEGDASVEVGDGQRGLRGVDVECEDGARGVEAEIGGSASAGELAGAAFDDPAVGDELLDDDGDGGARQAAEAREVGAGDVFVAANEIEEEVAVDFSRRAIGGGEALADFGGGGGASFGGVVRYVAGHCGAGSYYCHKAWARYVGRAAGSVGVSVAPPGSRSLKATRKRMRTTAEAMAAKSQMERQSWVMTPSGAICA